MQTVVELEFFLRAAKRCGMSEQDRLDAVSLLACDPEAGDEMPGTGGCRKVRLAGRGKGKSGGYRLITFFSGPAIPVFLITVYPKSTKVALTAAEQRGLGVLAKELTKAYRQRVVKFGTKA